MILLCCLFYLFLFPFFMWVGKTYGIETANITRFHFLSLDDFSQVRGFKRDNMEFPCKTLIEKVLPMIEIRKGLQYSNYKSVLNK